MHKSTSKILGLISYLILVIPICFLIWVTREHYNWITGGVKQIGVIVIWIISIVYLVVLIARIKYKKIDLKFGRLFIGLIILLLLVSTPFYFYKPFEKLRAKKELNELVEEIDLMYVAWSCYCPRWITPEDYKKDNYSSDLCIHIEPRFDSIALPDKYLVSGNIVKFKGQFYKYPQKTGDIEDGGFAPIFSYTSYELSNSAQSWTSSAINSDFNTPRLDRWLDYYKLKISDFTDSLPIIEYKTISFEFEFKENDIFNQFYIFHPDSTKIIDLDSYSLIIEKDSLGNLFTFGSGVDLEVAIIDTIKQRRTRVLFCGTECMPEEACWIRDDFIYILGFSKNEDLDYATIWTYELNNNFFQEIKANKPIDLKGKEYLKDIRLKMIEFKY